MRENTLRSIYPSTRFSLEREEASHLIKPTYSSRGISNIEFDAYICFIEQLMRAILPEDLLVALTTSKNQDLIGKKLHDLNAELPIIAWNNPEKAPCTLTASLLCPSEFTNGVGRYLCDTLSRWLVPGKFLNISSVRSLNFNFIAQPEQNYFFQQILLDISSEQELTILQANKESLEKELRLNILAVKHARNVVAVKKLSPEQKKILIEENISSVIDRPSKNLDNNVYDQMQHFLLHLNAEEKITQIKEQFTPLLEQRPKLFDRDIFKEIKHSVILFGDKFTAMRELKHVSRLISFQFLFRKSLIGMVNSHPSARHVSLKLLKTHLSHPKRTVLGIIGAMNVLRENELFEERHILEAIRHSLPDVKKVEHSFIIDRRSHDPIRVFYIEIEKQQGMPFSFEEIKELKKHLPRELKESVESVIHPVLMPRNEEEVMRNTLLLSQQLRFVGDRPQVILSFYAQTEESLIFTVILVRLWRENEPSIAEAFRKAQTDLLIEELEVKQVGFLRKKHRKQANIFKVILNKQKFLRKDYSIDLFRARQTISLELNRIFKGIRDFNGGILSKQQEVFQELQKSLKETSSPNDFLLENFFYSLTPPLRQMLMMPQLLKKLYLLMLDALDSNFNKTPYSIKVHHETEHLLLMMASTSVSLKEQLSTIINKLKIPLASLSYTHVQAYGITCIGYIYQSRDPAERELLISALQELLIPSSRISLR